jgi:hypothetical protein
LKVLSSSSGVPVLSILSVVIDRTWRFAHAPPFHVSIVDPYLSRDWIKFSN